MQLFVALLWSMCMVASGFKWHLTDTLPSEKILTFSERYMFATGLGPSLLEQGNSYIHIDTYVYTYSLTNTSNTIGYAIFAASENHQHDNLQCLCGECYIRDNNPWAVNIDSKRTNTKYVTQTYIDNPSLGLNGTYYVWGVKVLEKYTVNLEAWHNAAFQLCTSDTETVAQIDGEIAFRNPYGFIPAELFGFLPFEGARMIAFVIFSVIFLFLYCKHYDTTLRLHTMILLVFLVGLVEAVTWYSAYQTINLTGEPYCCPFPKTVVAALVLQVFRQTFARALLLTVSLGYGIVRPKLLTAEWIGITIITLCYFASATIAQVAEIILVHDVHDNSPTVVIPYQIPELFMDVIFLTWIYVSLGSTIRILNDYRQTYKLLMYKQLAFTIGIFVGLFAFVTVLILLDKFNIITWPWQYAWVQQVLWEVLNFSILAAVCMICRPSGNSRLLSYASQLPTEDPDENDNFKDVGESDDDDDDDAELEGQVDFYRPRGSKIQMTTRNALNNKKNQRDVEKGVFSSLPAADDEDDFGKLNE